MLFKKFSKDFAEMLRDFAVVFLSLLCVLELYFKNQACEVSAVPAEQRSGRQPVRRGPFGGPRTDWLTLPPDRAAEMAESRSGRSGASVRGWTVGTVWFRSGPSNLRTRGKDFVECFFILSSMIAKTHFWSAYSVVDCDRLLRIIGVSNNL